MAGVPLADIALDPATGKIWFKNGRFKIVTDHDARRQILQIALKHFRGEWFRDEDAGTDYRGAIVGKNTDLARRAELRKRCLSVPGIQDVRAMTFKTNPVTRAMDVTIEAVASDGFVITASTAPGS